ncbi:MAG: ClbS/DfsB family four-helix bundle protein [Anaerolineae bacterium]
MFERMDKAQLLANIQQGWDALHGYLSTLTVEQLTTPTDAAGWTAKDHLIHLAVWEESLLPLLEGKARYEVLGIDKAMWERHDYDEINAVIQARYKGMALAAVKQTLSEVHQRVLAKVGTLSEEDLHRPYNYYQPESSTEYAIIGWIIGNTYEHYADHRGWMAAIVTRD